MRGGMNVTHRIVRCWMTVRSKHSRHRRGYGKTKIRCRRGSGVGEKLHKPLTAFASVSAIDILALPAGRVPTYCAVPGSFLCIASRNGSDSDPIGHLRAAKAVRPRFQSPPVRFLPFLVRVFGPVAVLCLSRKGRRRAICPTVYSLRYWGEQSSFFGAVRWLVCLQKAFR